MSFRGIVCHSTRKTPHYFGNGQNHHFLSQNHSAAHPNHTYCFYRILIPLLKRVNSNLKNCKTDVCPNGLTGSALDLPEEVQITFPNKRNLFWHFHDSLDCVGYYLAKIFLSLVIWRFSRRTAREQKYSWVLFPMTQSEAQRILRDFLLLRTFTEYDFVCHTARRKGEEFHTNRDRGHD